MVEDLVILPYFMKSKTSFKNTPLFYVPQERKVPIKA